jgi:polyferredoxin
VGAIPLDDPSQTNHDLCINCMRCVEICTMSSRALPEPFIAAATGMLNEKAAGYKRPVVFR